MNQRTKTVCRRVIRLLMVLLAAFLLAVAVGIPIINNGIAHGLEKHLKSIPLPADTQLVDSVSVAGKIRQRQWNGIPGGYSDSKHAVPG